MSSGRNEITLGCFCVFEVGIDVFSLCVVFRCPVYCSIIPEQIFFCCICVLVCV